MHINTVLALGYIMTIMTGSANHLGRQCQLALWMNGPESTKMALKHCVANRCLWQLIIAHTVLNQTCWHMSNNFSPESRIVQRQDCTWQLMNRCQHVHKLTPVKLSHRQQKWLPNWLPAVLLLMHFVFIHAVSNQFSLHELRNRNRPANLVTRHFLL